MILSLSSVVFAKNENAPGLEKKNEAVDKITSTSSQGRKTSSTEDVPDVLVVTSIVRGNSNKNLENKNSSNDKDDRNEGAQKQLEKFGAKEMKKLIEKASTDSAKKNTKSVLQKVELRRASSSATMKRHAVSGFIVETGNNQVVIAHNTQRDRSWIVTYDGNTQIRSKNSESTGSAGLVLGARIAAVGVTEGNVLKANSIHIIPGKFTGIVKRIPVATASGTITPKITGIATPSTAVTPVVTVISTPTATLSPSP